METKTITMNKLIYFRELSKEEHIELIQWTIDYLETNGLASSNTEKWKKGYIGLCNLLYNEKGVDIYQHWRIFLGVEDHYVVESFDNNSEYFAELYEVEPRLEACRRQLVKLQSIE